MKALRNRVYRILDGDRRGDTSKTLCDIFLVTLILVSVGAIIVESVTWLSAGYEEYFDWLELVVVGVFTVEYLARLWTAPDLPKYILVPPWKATLRYAVSPLALIDLAAILPFYLAFVLPWDLRFLRLFRLVT